LSTPPEPAKAAGKALQDLMRMSFSLRDNRL
jgi:hypothetical protein